MIFRISVNRCAGITCAVAGETCVGGICKCGTAASCENQATGAICDSDNNVCKCADTVAACTGGEICTSGSCAGELLTIMISFIVKYRLSFYY